MVVSSIKPVPIIRSIRTIVIIFVHKIMTMTIRKNHLIPLSVISGLMLAASWPLRGLPYLSLIALVPMLAVIKYISSHSSDFRKRALFRYSFPGMLVWNALTTWWLYYATDIGSILAIILNASLMSLTLQVGFFIFKHIHPRQSGIFIFPLVWLSFEFLHLRWELTWSWLNLGNVFASQPCIIQWYEYTGTLGGTLWIWICNILFFNLIKSKLGLDNQQPACKKAMAVLSIMIILPISVSLLRYYTYEEKGEPVKVAAIQPNIDPWKEEFKLSKQEIMQKIMAPTHNKHIPACDVYVAPESVLQEGTWEDEFDQSYSVDTLRRFLKKNSPGGIFVCGASTHRMYKPGESITQTARRYNDDGYYFDSFNTALFIDTSGVTGLYHKSKLVAGVEIMPYQHIFKPIEKLALNLGGTKGSLGTDSTRYVLKNPKISGGAAICYESIFGEFVGAYVRNGADILIIITNDGWWNNTPGHRQHYAYASLRAIETRRDIARSANTGISCFVNQRGDRSQATQYWTSDAIYTELHRNHVMTFYVRFGDYIGRGALLLSGLLFLYSIMSVLKRKKGALKK